MPPSLDLQLVLAAQHLMMSSTWSIALTVFFARWLIVVEVALALVCLFSKRVELRHAVQESAWSAGIAVIITTILSHLVLRARPYLASSSVALLIPPPFNTSFPSGHTSAAFAMASALFIADRRIGTVAFVLATLVAFGRVSAGVHYPSDILGGMIVALIGIGIVRTVHYALRRPSVSRSAAEHTHS